MLSGRVLTVVCMLTFTALAQQAKKPLVFEFDKEDAHRVKIYWDPSVDVKKIKDISNRDVHYVINNATGKVREEYTPWLLLVTEQDDVDPSRRLLFVKSDMCVEQDYKVSWYDSQGILHENITQRMEPSPEPWKPNAKIQISNLHYDATTKRIMGNLGWAMNDEKLRGIPKLGQLHPAVQLESCNTIFEKPVPLPVVDAATKIVSLDPLYAKHECSFSVRLRQMTYNGDLECRSLRETTDDHSDRVEMSCGQGLNYPECKDSEDQQPCSMTCDQVISASGDYDWSRGWPKPFVKIEWKPRKNDQKTVVSHLIRYAQVDTTYNNYPIEEFNVTFLEVNASVNLVKLEPFSNDPESLYTFQVCTLHEACFATAKWSSVPKYPIYATTITSKLPVLSTTLTPSTISLDPVLTIINGSQSENITEQETRRPPRSPVDPMVEVKTASPKGDIENTIEPRSSAAAFGMTCVLYLCLCIIFSLF